MAKADAEKKLETIRKERKEIKKKGFTIIIVLYLLSLLCLCIVLRSLFWGALASIVPLVGIVFFVTYYILGPVRILGYFVKQSRCLLILVGGRYKETDLQLEGHVVTDKGWIVPEDESIKSIPEEYGIDIGKRLEKKKSYANLRFFSDLGLFQRIFEDVFQWEKFNANTGDIEKKQDVISDWVVVIYNYGVEVRDVYTKDNVPISFNMGILTIHLNPSLAQFGSKNWYKAFMGQINNIVFEEIRSSNYADLQGEKEELAKHFYKKFGGEADKSKDSTIKMCLEKYGTYVLQVQIAKLAIPKAIIEAANEPMREEFQRKAVVIEAEMNRDRIVTEMSAVDKLFQSRVGITQVEFVELLRDPEEFKQVYGSLYAECRKDILDGMTIKKGTGMRIFTEGAGTGGNDFLNAAALFSKLSNNNSSQSDKKTEEKTSEKEEKIKKNLRGAGFTEEEIKKYS